MSGWNERPDVERCCWGGRQIYGLFFNEVTSFSLIRLLRTFFFSHMQEKSNSSESKAEIQKRKHIGGRGGKKRKLKCKIQLLFLLTSMKQPVQKGVRGRRTKPYNSYFSSSINSTIWYIPPSFHMRMEWFAVLIFAAGGKKHKIKHYCTFSGHSHRVCFTDK